MQYFPVILIAIHIYKSKNLGLCENVIEFINIVTRLLPWLALTAFTQFYMHIIYEQLKFQALKRLQVNVGNFIENLFNCSLTFRHPLQCYAGVLMWDTWATTANGGVSDCEDCLQNDCHCVESHCGLYICRSTHSTLLVNLNERFSLFFQQAWSPLVLFQ